MSNYLNTHKRSGFGFSLSSEIQKQVDLLSLENTEIDPHAPLYDIDQDLEAYADSTVEDQNELDETQQHLETISNTRNDIACIEDCSDRYSSTLDTIETLTEDLQSLNGATLSPVSTFFVRCALESSFSRIDVSKKYVDQAVPDLQSMDTEKTKGFLTRTLDTIKMSFFSTIQKSIVAMEHWCNTQGRLVKSLKKRCSKLKEKSNGFSHTSKTGEYLSATKDNIALAEFLFTGQADSKPEAIVKQLKILRELGIHYGRNIVPKLDKVLEGLTNLASGHKQDGSQFLDGSFTKTIDSLFSGLPHTSSQFDSHVGIKTLTTGHIFNAVRFDYFIPMPKQHMTKEELHDYADMFEITTTDSLQNVNATKNTWVHFALKGLNPQEVSNILPEVEHSLDECEALDNLYGQQIRFAHNLLSHSQTAIKQATDIGVAKNTIGAVSRIWRQLINGLSAIVSDTLAVCSRVLEYVGKSMSKWEGIMTSTAGHALSVVGKGVASYVLPELGYRALSKGLQHVGLEKARPHGYIPTASDKLFEVAGKVMTGVSVASDVYHGTKELHRRHTWDQTLKGHHTSPTH